MTYLFQPSADEQTLFRSRGFSVEANAILSEGLIHITNQRLLFHPTGGRDVMMERDRITRVTRDRFGFVPSWSVQADDDAELSLIAREGWLLQEALEAMCSHAWAAAGDAASAGRAARRLRSWPALQVLALALAAMGRAVLDDVGFRRLR